MKHPRSWSIDQTINQQEQLFVMLRGDRSIFRHLKASDSQNRAPKTLLPPGPPQHLRHPPNSVGSVCCNVRGTDPGMQTKRVNTIITRTLTNYFPSNPPLYNSRCFFLLLINNRENPPRPCHKTKAILPNEKPSVPSLCYASCFGLYRWFTAKNSLLCITGLDGQKFSSWRRTLCKPSYLIPLF